MPTADTTTRIDKGDSEQVAVATMDAYFERTQFGAKVDFIKIDVEDHELSVLQGAKQILTNNPRIAMMLECTPEGCRRAGRQQSHVFGYLRELGFEIYRWMRKQKSRETREDLLAQAANVWAISDSARLPRPDLC